MKDVTFDSAELVVRRALRSFDQKKSVAYPGRHDSPHFQMAPKVSAKSGSSASIVANRSIKGSNRNSGMVGINS
jgi:hypothetical protein